MEGSSPGLDEAMVVALIEKEFRWKGNERHQ